MTGNIDKNDWLINNRNIFELDEIESISFFTIQCEIIDQVKNKNIENVIDFLNSEVDTTKKISGTKELSIDKIFNENLKIDFNVLNSKITHVSLIYSYFNLWLFRKYIYDSHKAFFTNGTYKKEYESLKNNYLNSYIDTDENDFITNELKINDSLMIELKKPIYNKIDLFGGINDEPAEFKKYLSFTIDKRIKFLKECQEFLQLESENSLKSEIKISSSKELLPQTKNRKPEIKYRAKHYVLTYILDTYAMGNNCPVGNKRELEKIGNEIMGHGSGNTFYKNFNSIINTKDLYNEKNLIEIGGEKWGEIVLSLSTQPEQVDRFLKEKQL